MKYPLMAILALAIPAGAEAQSKDKDYKPLIKVVIFDDGAVATSVGAIEPKERHGYSPGAEAVTVFWVEAKKPKSGPAEVYLLGQRLRYILPSEAPKQREWGPSDPKDPVSVGSPWTDADLRYHNIKIECVSDAYWCTQIWSIEIPLPDSVVRSVVSNPKKKEIPVSLSKRRQVEWRTPREELVATLDAIGALAEFSQPAP